MDRLSESVLAVAHVALGTFCPSTIWQFDRGKSFPLQKKRKLQSTDMIQGHLRRLNPCARMYAPLFTSAKPQIYV